MELNILGVGDNRTVEFTEITRQLSINSLTVDAWVLSGSDALSLAKQKQPDMIVWRFTQGNIEEKDYLWEILNLYPETPVILFLASQLSYLDLIHPKHQIKYLHHFPIDQDDFRKDVIEIKKDLENRTKLSQIKREITDPVDFIKNIEDLF